MEEEGEAVEQEQLKLVREVAKREETVETQGDAVASHGTVAILSSKAEMLSVTKRCCF